MGPCPGNLHLYDNRYFYVHQGLGLGKCVTTLVRDAAVQVLHQHYHHLVGVIVSLGLISVSVKQTLPRRVD